MSVLGSVYDAATRGTYSVITAAERVVGYAANVTPTKLPHVYDGPQIPIIFVGGIGSTPDVYTTFLKGLTQDGFEHVYVAPLADDGWAPIQQSSKLLDQTVDRVLAETGAPYVYAIGHSEGGLVIRQSVTFGTSSGKIARAVTLDSPHDGVGPAAAGALTSRVEGALQHDLSGAASQMVAGSQFLRHLNAKGLPSGTQFLSVASTQDLLVPFESSSAIARMGAQLLPIHDGPIRANHFSIVSRNPTVHAGIAEFFATGDVRSTRLGALGIAS